MMEKQLNLSSQMIFKRALYCVCNENVWWDIQRLKFARAMNSKRHDILHVNFKIRNHKTLFDVQTYDWSILTEKYQACWIFQSSSSITLDVVFYAGVLWEGKSICVGSNYRFVEGVNATSSKQFWTEMIIQRTIWYY